MSGRTVLSISESGIPTGLNRIKTKVESWAQEPHQLNESPNSSGFSISEFHVKRKVKAMSKGYGRLGRPKEGFHKGRKIAQWLSSSLLKSSHQTPDDSLTTKSTLPELSMPEKEDNKSKLCRMQNVSASATQKTKITYEVPKSLKSFSHELDLKPGNQSGFSRTRSFNDMKELLGSLRSRFDAAKEVVNIELGYYSWELLETLQKDGLFTPDEYKMAEELYILSRQCIDMSSADFRKNCGTFVLNLNVKRQACQAERLKLLYTRILYILTRCTRLLHFERDIIEPSEERSLDMFRECLERIPSIDMSWAVDKGFLECDVENGDKEKNDSTEKLRQNEHLLASYIERGNNSMSLAKLDDDFINVPVQSSSASLSRHVKSVKSADDLLAKNLYNEKDYNAGDLNSVICRICEEPVPASHLEPHSYICAFADKCFSQHLDVNERLFIAAELLERIAESHSSNNNDSYENLEFSRAGITSPAINAEGYSPKSSDCRGKGMNGLLEDLHEMDTACIEDSRLANFVNLKNHWLTKVNHYGSPSSNCSMTSASSTCSPQEGNIDNFLSDLYLLEQEDLQQINELADIACCVAATDISEEGSPVFLLACMHDLQEILHNNKYKGLLVDTFGSQIEGLLREKYILACNQIDRPEDIRDQDSTRALMDTASQCSTTSTPSHSAHKERTTIDDFDIIKQISRGAYGKVFLARKRTTGDLFAIKVLRKLDMLHKNDIGRILAERNILITTRNPFVVRFFYSFTSKANLYLVMEYLNGGDLYSLLKHVGCLDEAVARSYIAELVLALQYLHSLGIVHRDLKPDNILIAQDGHIKLTDFGLSKIGLMNCTSELSNEEKKVGLDQLNSNAAESHLLAVGTPDYLAPEILLGTEHGYAADWWSVGIILFEFLTGVPPFNADDPENIFDNILNGKIPWPSVPTEMSHEAQDLINRLLVHEPHLRLGANGAEEVKAHPFFVGVDWDNLVLQKAAFIPTPEGTDDTSYFMSRYKSTSVDVDESSMDSDSDVSESRRNHEAENMDEYGDLAEFHSPIDLSLINFSFKNLSQLASINQVVLLRSGKEGSKTSSACKTSETHGS